MNKEKLDAFFDFVQDEGFLIEEVLEATQLWMIDYRDDILESDESKKKITEALQLMFLAQALVKLNKE